MSQKSKQVTCQNVQAMILMILELGQKAAPDSPEYLEHLRSCENCKQYAQSQGELRKDYGEAMAGVDW